MTRVRSRAVAGGVALAGLVLGAGIVARRRARTGAAAAQAQRAKRSARVARLAARAGADYASTRARGALASPERAVELNAEFELRTAEQVAEALGEMKGALMKLGQMASYLDQSLPEPVRETLAQLQSDAPPMSAELAASVVREELGAAPEEIFERWDPVPVASASIGQVHRAVTTDGRAVAVKVQYPGVAAAIAADLDNSEMLFSMLGILFPGLDPGPIVEEISERVREELDYEREAQNQRAFVEAYRDHPYIHVPEVISELSTNRVLTTEFVEGARFSEVLEWSDEERQLAAETIYRFVFGSIYDLHYFNGDPHPGNYIFGGGGRVTFLDFGLCKRFTPAEVKVFEQMIRLIALERDVSGFRSLIEEIGILPENSGFDDETISGYFGHFYEFVLQDSELEMTPEHSSESLRHYFDLSGPYAELLKAATLPASLVVIQRINLGLYAIFGDLRARNNWRRLGEEIWPFVDAGPATPMGEEIARWAEDR